MYEKSWMGKTLRERGLEDQKEGPSEAFGRQVLEGSRKAVGRESGAASAVLAAMGDGGGATVSRRGGQTGGGRLPGTEHTWRLLHFFLPLHSVWERLPGSQEEPPD